jgi:hypothetical protein
MPRSVYLARLVLTFGRRFEGGAGERFWEESACS